MNIEWNLARKINNVCSLFQRVYFPFAGMFVKGYDRRTITWYCKIMLLESQFEEHNELFSHIAHKNKTEKWEATRQELGAHF
jgi:hypothetical protein